MSGLPVLLFLDVSGGELLIILLVVFLVFGPEKMPEMARKAGRLMNQMKKASNDLTREFKKETSALENEIKAAQSKVNEQVASVNREFNSTKAEVAKNMKIDTDLTPPVQTEITDSMVSDDQLSNEVPSSEEISNTKTE